MNPDEKPTKIDGILASGLLENAFTAAQVALVRTNGPAYLACVGETEAAKVNNDTLFDIASLTKLFAAEVCLELVSRGRLCLDTPLHRLAPLSSAYESATLAHLLAHEAGFPASLPLFESSPTFERGTKRARDQMLSLAFNVPPVYCPGDKCIYSDIGYMILLHVLEDTTGMSISQVIDEEICRPLGLAHTRYLPLHRRPEMPENIAPTEDCPWRGKRLVGEVHDDNAWTMGGEAAHAGLFSTAENIAQFGIRQLSILSGVDARRKATAHAAVTRRPLGRGLGWDLKSPKGSSAGGLFSTTSFGHLGFTGCSLWVDPQRGLSAALLTNRVYFGRDNEKLRPLRPMFYDAAAIWSDSFDI